MKNPRRPGDPFGCEEDVAPVALDERPATEVADRETDVVPQQRTAEAEQSDKHDVQPPGARIHRRENQDGLAGNRDAKVLDEYQA